MQSTSQSTSSTDTELYSMRFVDGHYEMVEDGYSDPEPILHLFSRGEDMCQQHIRVDGYHPYFCVRLTEALNRHEQLNNDHRVRRIETVEKDESAITTNVGGGFGETIRLAKIYTIKPYHVRGLRENFEDKWEADVRFVDRFCYDTDIVDSFAVPRERLGSDEPLSADEIVTEDVACTTTPRIAYIDIEVCQNKVLTHRNGSSNREVYQSSDGPSVVSERGKELADNPITAISLYDNYTSTYYSWILSHETNSADDYHIDTEVRSNIEIFDTEWGLLSAFASHIKAYRYDIWTAWNMDFDAPYLINRYFTLDHMDVFNLSPTRGVQSMDGSGKWINGDIEGVLLFDLLTAYEKCQIHELSDSRLETVAAAETDIEKLSIDGIDDAWVSRPSEFVEYSIRDVEAIVAINDAVGILT